jgi:hypothetical protein
MPSRLFFRGNHRGETVDEFSTITGSKKTGDPQKLVSGHCRLLPGRYGTFLKGQKDPFANPVGKTTHQSLDALVDALITGAGRDVMAAALDPILRIRAVQTFTPSKATSFVFSLKQIIRQHLPDAGP